MSIKMNSVLGVDQSEMDNLGGQFTAAEIVQQPAVWRDVRTVVDQHRVQIDAFLKPLLEQKNLRIILTGAGTSAFIGQCMAPVMLAQLDRRVEAIPTTDLVSGPALYFQQHCPTLMVSFARSGSSPESLAAVHLANQFCDSIHHIIVTCNEQGELFETSQGAANVLTLLLPPESHDRGFAMTSSFTSMLYSASLIFDLVDTSVGNCRAIGRATQHLMEDALPLIQSLVSQRFERVVYLGSNGLRGLAQEAALKLLELTDGRVVASFDSPLGFRHGPKTIVNDKTLVVLFLTNHAYTRQYDLDLLRELRNDGKAGKVVALNACAVADHQSGFVQVIGLDQANDLELAFPYIVFAQIFALLNSLALGNTPDRPSSSGTVNRVVQGVQIYPAMNRENHVSGR
jgi:tagatose-6-phosphate ketose/aldose isomerase